MRRHLFLVLGLVTLAACSEPTHVPLASGPDLASGTEVFVATTRARDAETDWYSSGRNGATSYLTVPVHFPDGYVPGDRARVKKSPKPGTDFWVEPRSELTATSFQNELRAAVAQKPAGARDVTVFVHGFYNSFFNGVFRSAQLQRDFDLPGVMVHYAWPSRGSSTAYAYDRDSVLFARDGFADLLGIVSSVGAERITIIGHSLGGLLAMESLRQIDLGDPGWVHDHIDGLALISPDIDVDVFRRQADALQALPNDTVIFISDKDQVLLLSGRLAGDRPRVGAVDSVTFDTDGQLTIVDLSDLSRTARSGHFIPATSPVAIRLINQGDSFLDFFPRRDAGQAISANVSLFKLGLSDS